MDSGDRGRLAVSYRSQVPVCFDPIALDTLFARVSIASTGDERERSENERKRSQRTSYSSTP